LSFRAPSCSVAEAIAQVFSNIRTLFNTLAMEYMCIREGNEIRIDIIPTVRLSGRRFVGKHNSVCALRKLPDGSERVQGEDIETRITKEAESATGYFICVYPHHLCSCGKNYQ